MKSLPTIAFCVASSVLQACSGSQENNNTASVTTYDDTPYLTPTHTMSGCSKDGIYISVEVEVLLLFNEALSDVGEEKSRHAIEMTAYALSQRFEEFVGLYTISDLFPQYEGDEEYEIEEFISHDVRDHLSNLSEAINTSASFIEEGVHLKQIVRGMTHVTSETGFEKCTAVSDTAYTL